MSKHYAAPWGMVVRDDGYAEINAKGDGHYAFAKVVVRMADPEDTTDNDRLMANARLIAAAPDGLHAAGVAYLALLNLPQTARALPHVQHAMATVRDFIAKATNRTDEDTQAEYETSATLGAS